jgi:hypothetical protein
MHYEMVYEKLVSVYEVQTSFILSWRVQIRLFVLFSLGFTNPSLKSKSHFLAYD